MNATDDKPELLYAATKRHVIALDPFSGDEIWKTKLPKFTGSFVSLMNTPHTLFAARSNGIIHALDKWTGEILWEKTIRELRNQPISLASSLDMTSTDLNAMTSAASAQRAAAAAAASTG